jgi:molecular chaperone HscA
MAKIAINIATGTLQKDDMIVGIDLGTTNSLVAMIHPDTKEPVALKDVDQSTLVPSVIHFGTEGGLEVGQEAKAFLETDPAHTIYSVKRLMGKSYADVEGERPWLGYKVIDPGDDGLVRVQVGDRFYTPIELSSLILKQLKDRAEHALKMPVSRCVITVPAYFNDAQRQATRDAGKLAGLDVLRILNEPTAASLAYGFGVGQSGNRTIAVYDLGGGTFDVSILRIQDGIFDVLSTHGDTHLGGDDFDRMLQEHFRKQTGLTAEELGNHRHIAQGLRLRAEEAKKWLSTEAEYRGEFQGTALHITREQFEVLIAPLVERTLNSCRQALQDSGLKKEEIDVVVMVGGSTRVPVVKQKVGEFFGREVFDRVNPDEVVALGAAIQADILAGNQSGTLLLDVTPLSLGIETMGGLMDVLIPRNTKIPARAGRQYTTQRDGQGSMRISVFQGERDLVKDNRELAEFNLSGIPGMPAGLPKVEVKFTLDADGILQVKASELRSGVSQSIEVKPQYGLTDAQVEEMLMASLTHAREDMQTRALLEASTEAETMLQLTENFMQKHERFITDEERKTTKDGMDHLRRAVDEKNKDGILKATEELNEITKPYAERVMDAAVQAALQGKRV